MPSNITELGECVACGRAQLVSIPETGTIEATRQNGACGCGADHFARLSVDEAFSKLTS